MGWSNLPGESSACIGGLGEECDGAKHHNIGDQVLRVAKFISACFHLQMPIIANLELPLIYNTAAIQRDEMRREWEMAKVEFIELPDVVSAQMVCHQGRGYYAAYFRDFARGDERDSQFREEGAVFSRELNQVHDAMLGISVDALSQEDRERLKRTGQRADELRRMLDTMLGDGIEAANVLARMFTAAFLRGS